MIDDPTIRPDTSNDKSKGQDDMDKTIRSDSEKSF
jgi:hypothetical protein